MLQTEMIHNFEQAARFIFVPGSEDEYDQLVELLDELTDIVRDDENHPLANLMDVVGVLIEAYENETISEPVSDPISTLKHFMEEYDLNQQDLAELGDREIVSEILSGKQELNVSQIKALSKRFHVPASVFI
ncbi:MAG: transcriptional regulator [Anaerolineae bacterium]|nr:transcriptional regulator [Anaerolineae bacterium]